MSERVPGNCYALLWQKVLMQPFLIRFLKTETILPQIMARAFISFQQLLTPATIRDQRVYETGVY